MNEQTLSTRRRGIPHAGAAALVVLVVPCLILGLVIAPPDAVQGEWQRMMYLHVPAAWSAYLCFAIVLAASIRYLVRPGATSARLGRAATEIGILLTALTLVTGSAWGAATWGTWWAWDGRTISTVAMGLVYVMCLAVRWLEVGRTSRTVSAVIGVVGFAVVPVVHLSVLWWPTLHQPATILAPSVQPPLHPLMGAALAASVLTFTLATVLLLRVRVRSLAVAPAEDAQPSGRLIPSVEQSSSTGGIR